MLSDIKFDGFNIVSSSFKVHKDSGEGRFEVKFDEVSINNMIDPESESKLINIITTPKLIGYSRSPDKENEYDEEPSFEAEVVLKLSFRNNCEVEIDDNFYRDNSWFFENFISIAVKLSIESLLTNTMFEAIQLPWGRPDTEILPEESE